MSSRALRRLQQDANVIKVSGRKNAISEDDEEDLPGFVSKPKNKKTSTANPFAAVSGACGCGQLL